MADWVTGKVTKVQNWTDALFSLTVHAPVLPFTAGQFTKLGLEIDGERVQRAYSYVNSPDNPDLEFYLVTVPDGKLSPRLAALKPGDEVQVVSEAAGFFVLDEVPDCETLWMLATGTAIGPYLSILQLGKDLERFKNLVLVHAARYAADLSYLPLMQELEKRYEGKLRMFFFYNEVIQILLLRELIAEPQAIIIKTKTNNQITILRLLIQGNSHFIIMVADRFHLSPHRFPCFIKSRSFNIGQSESIHQSGIIFQFQSQFRRFNHLFSFIREFIHRFSLHVDREIKF